MKSPLIHALAPWVLLVTASRALAEDVPLKEGTRVRLHAGNEREIPGVMIIKPESTELKGDAVIVANDNRLVAVKVPGQEEPFCLPRPGRTLTGQLVAMDDETWTITIDGHKTPFKVPRSAIEAIDVSRGHPSILLGTSIGAAAGVGVGVAAYSPRNTLCFGFCPTKSTWAIVGGGLGALVGASVAAATTSERWETVSRGVHFSVKPVAQGRGLSLAVSF